MASTVKIDTLCLVLLVTVAFVQCWKMSEEENSEEVFMKMSRGKLEDERTREEFSRQLNTHGKTLYNYLNPEDAILFGVDTPVWRAFTRSDGQPYYKRMAKGIIEKAVEFWKRNHVVDRTIEEKLADGISFPEQNFHFIRARSIMPDPFPEALRKSPEVQDHRGTDGNSSFKNEDSPEKLERTVHELNQIFQKTNSTTENGSKKDIVYPSILITTAYEEEQQSENDFDYLEEIVYQMAFWNAVDLRFREASNPQVRLRIAGIIIGQDPGATPYIFDKSLSDEKTNGIKIINCLLSMQDYWNKKMISHPEFPLEAYHVVITMTDRKIDGPNVPESLALGYLGSVFIASLCSRNLFDAMAIIHDNRHFDGHLTAVNKLAQIMGSTKEGMCQNEYENQLNGKHLFCWTECRLKEMSTFLRQPNGNCIHQPAEFYPPGKPADKILPGEVMDDNGQCNGLGIDWACEIKPEMCKKLMCFDSGFVAFFEHRWKCRGLIPAADGTFCGLNKKCLDGKCVCVRNECLTRQSHDEREHFDDNRGSSKL